MDRGCFYFDRTRRRNLRRQLGRGYPIAVVGAQSRLVERVDRRDDPLAGEDIMHGPGTEANFG